MQNSVILKSNPKWLTTIIKVEAESETKLSPCFKLRSVDVLCSQAVKKMGSFTCGRGMSAFGGETFVIKQN